jgi:uncharacterized protein YoxC
VGSVRTDRTQSFRIFTRRRVAAFVVALLALAGATVFVVKTRDDLRAARDGLSRSEHNLDVLDARQRDAVTQRTHALEALDRARALLANDTAARERMLETVGAQYGLLTEALQKLSQHQAELAASAAHAKLLDDCLAGASQVLNEAAVGDVVHLASTLPPVQRLCTQAAA